MPKECCALPSRGVVVAVADLAFLRLVLDLLEQDRHPWCLHAVTHRPDLPAILAAASPDLVVLDDADTGWSQDLHLTFPPRRVIAPAILVGITLELLKYVNALTWPWLRVKLEREYGPFAYSVTIILWSFLAAMVILAGAEWSARSQTLRESRET